MRLTKKLQLLLFSGIPILLGIALIMSWLYKTKNFLFLATDYVPFHIYEPICFIFSGMLLLLHYYPGKIVKKIQIFLAVVLIAFSMFMIIQDRTGISAILPLQKIFKTSQSVSKLTDLSLSLFICVGIHSILFCYRYIKIVFLINQLLALIILGVAISAVVGYWLHFELIFTLFTLTRMSFVASIVFVLLGMGFFIINNDKPALEQIDTTADSILIPLSAMLFFLSLISGLSVFAVLINQYKSTLGNQVDLHQIFLPIVSSLLKIIPIILLTLMLGIAFLYRQIAPLLREIVSNEKKITKSDRLKQSLLDSANYLIFSCDADGLINTFNKTAELYLGYKSLEVVGKEKQSLFHEKKCVSTRVKQLSEDFGREVDAENEVFIAKAMVTGVDESEWSFVRKDGSHFPVLVSTSILRDTKGEMLGSLGIATDITKQRDLESAKNKANQELKTSLREIHYRNEQLLLIKDLISILQVCFSIQEAASLISTYCKKLLPHSSGCLYIISGSTRLLELLLTWGTPVESKTRFQSDECWALRTGALYQYYAKDIGLRCKHCSKNDDSLHKYICIPLFAQGSIIGLLYIEHIVFQEKTTYVELITMTLAEQLALGMSNIILREKMRDQSIRDPLTNLFNRRYFQEMVPREIYRASREEKQLAFVMFDIDHFKKINDTIGHEVGDEVLKSIANELLKNVRKWDLISRYGGEEFLMIIINVTPEIAMSITEKIRNCVANLRLYHKNQDIPEVTISAGISFYPEDGASMQELIEVADKMLYKAKSAGRNTVKKSH